MSERLPPGVAADLLDWYRANARDLPWRRTRDPYAILVSEVMLQQTRVETVQDRYVSFLQRFPDLVSLAAAEIDEVLAEWSGLGYYRRARALHNAARKVTQHYGGQLPTTAAELQLLPGIGPYTAAAVASIAFEEPTLALDGNVARVLCRLAAIKGDPRRSAVRRQLHDRAGPFLAVRAPGDLNQALMELGARVCLPGAPRCAECPCQRHCRAYELGIQGQIPPTRAQAVREVQEKAVLVEDAGRYFLVRGQRPGVLRDMWELPTLDSRLESASHSTKRSTDPRAKLANYLAANGWPIRLAEPLGEIRHGITNRRITCTVYRGHLSTGRGEAATSVGLDPVQCGWFTLEEVTALPLAASARKAFTRVLGVDLTRT